MALKLKYTDEHGILHIDMSPSISPVETDQPTDPKFDTINNRFGNYDIFGGKYDSAYDRKYEDKTKYESSETQSLFRSRYNSFEEEFANTPYAFASNRSLRNEPLLDITIDSRTDVSPSKDIENDRFFDRADLFGPKIDLKSDSFTVTHLIHAQDRYFDLSTRVGEGRVKSIADGFEAKSVPNSAKKVKSVNSDGDAFKVLSAELKRGRAGATTTAVSTSKRKRETSFAIIAEPATSRPASPRSLPVDIRAGRVSPFKGRGFKEETSRHNTPKTSAANSRCNSPPRRTSSLTRIDNMAPVATLPPPGPVHRPPRDFLKENKEEVRELSELNREKNEAEAEKQRKEEEIALLKEMGLLDRKSNVNSRTNSRSNSPGRINLRSQSNSPSAILHFENIPRNSSEFLNKEETINRPVAHRSRVRSISKSQPQSSNGSPKNSKIPKRQNSVSPTRSNLRQSVNKTLNGNQRFMSNSTSSINETIRIGSQMHDKRITQSNQQLNVSQPNVKSKPPISPGRSGPPPSNKSINAKRLSPIVGTPNKSPVEDSKPGSAKPNSKPTTAATKAIKTAGNTPATSRLNSRQPSRTTSRDASPDKRKPPMKTNKPISTTPKPPVPKTTQKPPITKSELKKPVSRTNTVKNLTRVPSTKNLNDKPPLSRQVSKKELPKTKSTNKLNELTSKSDKPGKTTPTSDEPKKNGEVENKEKKEVTTADANFGDEIQTQDNGTQYDKTKSDNGDMVILTKKNVVSMTTAAITSQPLEVVTTVTNQLPAALEKAREKGMFERLSSKDSLVGKEEDKKETAEEKEKEEKKPKPKTERTIFAEDNLKLKPLQPPYNNPQVERVKQKIDTLLKEPEISTENILEAAKAKEAAAKSAAEKVKSSIKEAKIDIEEKVEEKTEEVIKKGEEMTADIRSEATKIVDSIITPVEEPEKLVEKVQKETKTTIEPVVKVVSEKKKEVKAEVEKMTETLVQGGPELDVQSSNLSTGADNMALKPTTGSASDRSHSNGGFPPSADTTPKPPPRARRGSKEKTPPTSSDQPTSEPPKQNICTRLLGKCKAKCCPCCLKKLPEALEDGEVEQTEEVTHSEQVEKKKLWEKINCFKKKVPVEEVEIAAGKGTTIEFETETKRKRKLRDALCSCCRRQRVADVTEPLHAHVTPHVTPPVASSDVVKDAGCCGKRREAERRDSILSDQAPSTCCNNRLCRWLRGACRRQSTVADAGSRRTSLFSKNKSLSPTLPPEDTRKKLDPSLIEHTSVMRGAIPVLPTVLAYFCLLCNIIIPGLGTIFSGMFCLCFGIPRFGVHDGAKHRIGSFIINLVVGAGQLFTVLFCLVGWGWSIWWGVIMVKTSRKYKKLKAEAAAEEAEAPPVTNNNHTRA